MLDKRLVPPVYLILAIGLMALLDAQVPGARPIGAPYRHAGFVGIVAGILLVIRVAWMFRRAGTTLQPFGESSALVVHGPFRWSRNPIYVGLTIVLAGIATLLGSLSPFAVIPAFVVVIDRLFVRAEEAALEERFGDAYRAYAARVRRWI